MIATLIWVIILVAVLGVVWWAIAQMSLPEPMRIVIVAVFAIICLLVLLYMVPMPHPPWGRP